MTFDQGFTSHIYVVPMGGGEPRLVTPNSPSFLHGWSPDGRELSYCAFRETDGRTEVDVYTIPASGGEEKRLTAGGFNDGPEYSSDGKTIWFNSTRSGKMQIWRMDRDGGNQEQVTGNQHKILSLFGGQGTINVNSWARDSRRFAFVSYSVPEHEGRTP